MYFVIGGAFALAAFLAADLLATAWTIAVSRALAGRAGRAPAARRRLFAILRVLPSVVALVAGVLAAMAYLQFEPPGRREGIGPALAVISAIAMALLAWGPLRAMRAWRATRRIESEWLRRADRVSLPDVGFPVWRVRKGADGLWMSGLLRPRVIVGAGVLDALTPPELEAALRHEAAHATGYDNLVRLCLTGAPGVLSILPHGRALERQWSRATETAADSAAASVGSATAVDLASALVKVARLRPPATLLAASAVDEGDVRARVHDLLDDDGGRPVASPLGAITLWAALLLPLVLVTALGTNPHVAGFVHSLGEHLVRPY
jgi:Zn-dependent protease with chaperone function